MQTLSPSISGTSGCDHKGTTRCRLDIQKCCACADLRPHSAKYTVYKDGRRAFSGLDRWSHYCTSCKDFWEHQIQLAGISPSASRIPEFPKPIISASSSYTPRYRPPIPASTQGVTPTRETGGAKGRKKKGRREHRHKKTDNNLSNTTGTSDQASASSSVPQNGTRPTVNLPKPQPYVCPAARTQNSSLSRDGGASSSERPKTWANLATPYSQPALPSQTRRQSALTIQIPPNDRRGNAAKNAQTASPVPGPSRRPVSWQTMLALNPPAESSRAQEERFRPLNWEGVPVPDAPDGSWSADVEGEWWRQPLTSNDTTTPRPTESQTLSQPSDGLFSASLSPPSENPEDWSNRTRSGTRRASANAQQNARRTQFGERPTNPQVFAVEDRQNTVNNLRNASGSQTAGNTTSDSDLNNENRGWLDWVRHVNTAQNRVMEHVNYFDGTQNPTLASSPIVSWGLPQSRSLANDASVRRQSTPNRGLGRARPATPESIADGSLSTGLGRFVSPYPIFESARNSNIFDTPDGTAVPLPMITPITRRPVPRIQLPPASPFGQDEWDVALMSTRDRAPTPGPPAPGPSILDLPSSAVDEWETWDAAILVPVVPPAPISTPSLDLAQAAEDASVLLELFSKTKPRNNEEIGDEHKQMIDNAFESISKIRREFRVMAARKNESLGSFEPTTSEAEDTKSDSECIICYDQIADTVLLPCKHLVLCNTCCDKMGIKEKNTPGPRTVQCPICRVKVLDKLKIFRG